MDILNNFPQIYYKNIFPYLKKENYIMFSYKDKFVALKCVLVQIQNETYTCIITIFNNISGSISIKLVTDINDKTTTLSKEIDNNLIEYSKISFEEIYNEVWRTLIKVLEETIKQLK